MSVRREKRRDPKTGAVREFWIVDFVFAHPDGRRERVRRVSPVSTRRGAEQYERELRAAMLNPPAVRKEVPTFEQFVNEHWWPVYPDAAGNRHTTRAEKASHLRLHLKPFFGRYCLDAIDDELIARFFAELRKKKLSEKSIKNLRTTLRRIFASAKEWKYIAEIPTLPRVKVPASPWDHLSPQETTRLIEATRNPEERALLLFAWHTGARAGEQIAFEWGDIDWHNHCAIFRRSSTRGIVGPTKTGKERRVPLTPTLEAALRAIKHLRGPLVFCERDGRPMRIWQLHERLWGALRRAGLRKIRWHDLRHTFGSQLAAAGVPLTQIQEWLGHSTITMTMRYAHFAPAGQHEQIALLDRAPHGNVMATERTGSESPKDSERKMASPTGFEPVLPA